MKWRSLNCRVAIFLKSNYPDSIFLLNSEDEDGLYLRKRSKSVNVESFEAWSKKLGIMSKKTLGPEQGFKELHANLSTNQVNLG